MTLLALLTFWLALLILLTLLDLILFISLIKFEGYGFWGGGITLKLGSYVVFLFVFGDINLESETFCWFWIWFTAGCTTDCRGVWFTATVDGTMLFGRLLMAMCTGTFSVISCNNWTALCLPIYTSLFLYWPFVCGATKLCDIYLN